MSGRQVEGTAMVRECNMRGTDRQGLGAELVGELHPHHRSGQGGVDDLPISPVAVAKQRVRLVVSRSIRRGGPGAHPVGWRRVCGKGKRRQDEAGGQQESAQHLGFHGTIMRQSFGKAQRCFYVDGEALAAIVDTRYAGPHGSRPVRCHGSAGELRKNAGGASCGALPAGE